MNKALKSRPFWIGVSITILVYFIISLVDYKTNHDGLCMDCNNDFGLPFLVYQSGSVMHATTILWFGVALNVAVLGIACIGTGILSHFLFERK